MKIEIIASFAAAAVLHGTLLFGFHMGSPAKPLPMRDDFAPVDVSLVEAAPPPPTVETPPEPAAAPVPEPVPTPAPEPEPMPTPTPEPEPVPSAEPSATPAAAPPRKNPAPPPPRVPNPLRARRPAAESAASSASGSSGANSRGAETIARPSYLRNPAPEYPVEARRSHQQGIVLLSVEVGANGRPREVVVKRSSGVRSLDEAAMQSVRRWTFEPAKAGGLPVASRADVPVRFSLAE